MRHLYAKCRKEQESEIFDKFGQGIRHAPVKRSIAKLLIPYIKNTLDAYRNVRARQETRGTGIIT